jgi:hypothetical protein
MLSAGILAFLFIDVGGYVIGEILAAARRHGHTELGLHILGVGFLAGIATDLAIAAGGA